MANDIQGVKFSQFPSSTPTNTDTVVGLHAGANARFTFANIIAAVRTGLANIFVPKTDVGSAGGVAALDATGKVPSSQLPSISSDAADISYDNTQSGLTADDVQEAIDELAAGAVSVDLSTIAPVEDSTTAAQAHPLGTIFYLNDLLYRALVDIPIGGTINTGAGGNATQTTVAQNFKRTVTLTSAEYAQLSAAEKAADIVYIITDDTIAAEDVTYDPTTSGLTATNAQDAIDEVYGDIPAQASDIGAQPTITANGILKGDGAGGVSAATPGTDYGTYSKPSGGIPASDMASAVQTSLGMADTSYQKGATALTSSDDLDNITTPGLYSWAASAPANAPITYCWLSVVSRNGAWANQYCRCAAAGYEQYIYERHKLNGGGWSSWARKAYSSLATEQQLAYVESGTTASRAYAVGENFCWNGLLYRVTAAISSGGTFTPGTNCETTTVMSAVTANWTPVNATTPYANRNYFFKAGKFIMIAVCIQLSSNLNAGQEREILSSVLSACGALVNPNQLTTNMGIAFLSSGNDIPIRIIFNGGKLYVRNQSGTMVDTSRIIYGQIVLGIQ